MTYLVAMYLGKECLMERGEMSEDGLRELLKHMSSLRNDGRSRFIHELKLNGSAIHKPDPDKKMQYSFAVVKKGVVMDYKVAILDSVSKEIIVDNASVSYFHKRKVFEMKLATLRCIDVYSRRFSYTLDVPYRYSALVPGVYHESRFFDVWSREDFTTVWSAQHRELIKTLGVKSHSEVLEELGYTRAVDLGFVKGCTDDELLTCLYEFERTGDDTTPFKWALDNR